MKYLHKHSYTFIGLCLSLSACSNHTLAPYSEAVLQANTHSKVARNSQQNEVDARGSSNTLSGQTIMPDDALNQPISSAASSININGYFCEDAQEMLGKSIGDGECVDLIKYCTGAPLTRFWKPGDYVFGNQIPAGTAIATFRKGKYPNKSGYHSAIYSHQDQQGIYAWDQWQGKKVHLRYIRADKPNARPGNDAKRYQVILR